MCLKLRSDKEKVEIELRIFREMNEEVEVAAAAAEVSASLASSAAAEARGACQEETAVTNVDSIHTIETSFVTSTAV